jgi:hypothetical protein
VLHLLRLRADCYYRVHVVDGNVSPFVYVIPPPHLTTPQPTAHSSPLQTTMSTTIAAGGFGKRNSGKPPNNATNSQTEYVGFPTDSVLIALSKQLMTENDPEILQQILSGLTTMLMTFWIVASITDMSPLIFSTCKLVRLFLNSIFVCFEQNFFFIFFCSYLVVVVVAVRLPSQLFLHRYGCQHGSFYPFVLHFFRRSTNPVQLCS